MRLLEYEAKQLLLGSGLPVPRGVVITKATLHAVTSPVVLKSQVPVGGRGKLGGVKVIEKGNTLPEIKKLFDHSIKGFYPKSILAEEKLAVQKEHYLSLLIDRGSAAIRLIAHRDGGVEVETQTGFLNVFIDTASLSMVSKEVSDYFDYPQNLVEPFLKNLLAAFVKNDATLIEINPLILTKAHQLVCGDCKMELDDAALFRHPEWTFEIMPESANFVVLNKRGKIATIANGAGLAMATVDAASHQGLAPANFLDIGGGATAESVLKAFKRILEFSHVQAIIINIFAGITHCDEIARAVITAKKQLPALPPLFIRLAGTNLEEAVALLGAQDIPTLATLEECLEKAAEVVHE